MKRVALIPTGQMELGGLAGCLQRLFPEHEFETLHQGFVGKRNQPEPFYGFTSSPLPSTTERPTTLTKLVEAMFGSLIRDKDRQCVVIDDLELANVAEPERVVAVVRAEIREMLEDLPSQRADDLADELKCRASFHFAVPMIESWLFADPARLTVASVPATTRVLVEPGRDPEDFRTCDEHYARADDSGCRKLRKRRGRRQPAPWNRSDRHLHPKAYLSWLCRDPDAKNCTTYHESRQGRHALEQLDWSIVLRNENWMSYARSLIEDLADALDCWPRGLARNGREAPLTSIHHPPRDPVLRNL